MRVEKSLANSFGNNNASISESGPEGVENLNRTLESKAMSWTTMKFTLFKPIWQ